MTITTPTAQQVTGNVTTLYAILTGVREVDAILANSKWGGALGTGASVTYSFPSLVTQFDRSNVFGAYGADTGNAARLASADFRGFREAEQGLTDQDLAAFAAQAIEGLVQVHELLGRHADAAVLYLQGDAAVGQAGMDVDGTAFAVVLDGVGEHVDQHLAQPDRIALDEQARAPAVVHLSLIHISEPTRPY